MACPFWGLGLVHNGVFLPPGPPPVLCSLGSYYNCVLGFHRIVLLGVHLHSVKGLLQRAFILLLLFLLLGTS